MMGVLNFMVDMSQSARLGDHDDEIKVLKENVAQLSRWVMSLNGRVANFENMVYNMPTEAMTDAEKRAYAFGWFKALEVKRLDNGNE